MNTEQIKQIVETIKTLNINFNDATTQKIADIIIPVVNKYFYVIIFEDILAFIGISGTVCFVAWLIYKASINSNNDF